MNVVIHSNPNFWYMYSTTFSGYYGSVMDRICHFEPDEWEGYFESTTVSTFYIPEELLT